MEVKNRASSKSQRLTKDLRLKKKKDFKFERFERFKTEHFLFIVSFAGHGRLGMSLSKKVLKTAVARNRIRRLLRESFRKNPEIFGAADVNVLGSNELSKHWKTLDYSDVEKQMFLLKDHLKKRRNG